MCVDVQPVCNACNANALPVELHECIFRGCKYREKRTRFLTRDELHEFLKDGCSTPGCGLNIETINGRLAEIDRMLRMDEDPPLKPAEGDSDAFQEDDHATSGINPPKSIEGDSGIRSWRRRLAATDPSGTQMQFTSLDSRSCHSTPATQAVMELDNLRQIYSGGQASSKPRGFDGDGTSLAHTTKPTTGLNVTTHENGSPNDGVTINDEVATDEVATNDNLATNESPAGNGHPVGDDDAAGNDSVAASDNVVADSSVQTIFDPDAVDLGADVTAKFLATNVGKDDVPGLVDLSRLTFCGNTLPEQNASWNLRGAMEPALKLEQTVITTSSQACDGTS